MKAKAGDPKKLYLGCIQILRQVAGLDNYKSSSLWWQNQANPLALPISDTSKIGRRIEHKSQPLTYIYPIYPGLLFLGANAKETKQLGPVYLPHLARRPCQTWLSSRLPSRLSSCPMARALMATLEFSAEARLMRSEA